MLRGWGHGVRVGGGRPRDGLYLQKGNSGLLAALDGDLLLIVSNSRFMLSVCCAVRLVCERGSKTSVYVTAEKGAISQEQRRPLGDCLWHKRWKATADAVLYITAH